MTVPTTYLELYFEIYKITTFKEHIRLLLNTSPHKNIGDYSESCALVILELNFIYELVIGEREGSGVNMGTTISL